MPERFKIIEARVYSRLSIFSEFVNRRIFVLLVTLGFLLRVFGAFLYGTGDMEWWKAWGTYSVEQNLTQIYGAKDADIIARWREGKHFGEVLKVTQRAIPYRPHEYSQTEYPVVQPPIYLYSIYLSTKLYKLVSPNLDNNRLFNFFLNLEPILSSVFISLIIFRFTSQAGGVAMGQLCGLAYWCNPVVILNAPVQAFRDPLCVLFAVLSIVLIYRKKLPSALICLVFALSTKPQGVLIAPVVLAVGLREHSLAVNLKAWASGVLAGLLVALPYLLSGRTLSMVQGVLSVTDYSHNLSVASMNLWWPVQYAMHAVSEVLHGTGGLWVAVLGGRYSWRLSLPAAHLTPYLGFNVEIIGFVLFTLFTVINIRFVLSRIRLDRSAILIAATLQVYGYFILRVGVQNNHYFILVALLTLACCFSNRGFFQLTCVCTLFLLQDLVFYGFGRDFNHGVSLLSKFYMGWTTVALALMNVGLFIHLCRYYYREAPSNEGLLAKIAKHKYFDRRVLHASTTISGNRVVGGP